MRTLRSQKGFSLIELMIVVAIIGILASIAIPNYQRFQRKSRQAEARANLSAYYTSSMATFAEEGRHFGNFVAIGFQPVGAVTYRITAADDGVATGPQFGPEDTTCAATDACGAPPAGFITWADNGIVGAGVVALPQGNTVAGAIGPVPVGEGACAPTNVAGATFTTCATANLGVAGRSDGWSINQARRLQNSGAGFGQSGI